LWQAARAERDGDTATQIEQAYIAAAASPADPVALSALARAQRLEKKTAEATVTLRQALALDPYAPHLHYNRALYLYQLGDVAGAERQAREGLKSVPGFVATQLLLANILIERGDPDEARKYLAAARRARPGVERTPPYLQAAAALGGPPP
jgi:tetratricopeptide (TPR) repeat protein